MVSNIFLNYAIHLDLYLHLWLPLFSFVKTCWTPKLWRSFLGLKLQVHSPGHGQKHADQLRESVICLHIVIYVYLHIYLYLYIYIFIYAYTERERERSKHNNMDICIIECVK